MKKPAWIALIAAAAGVIALTLWIGVSNSDERTASADAPTWLFSLSSDSGTLTQNSDGSYELVLTGPDEAFTAFTDRPYRDAAAVPLFRAVQAWPQVFAASPPNAVLVEHSPSGDSDSWVLELSDPKLGEGSTMAFHAIPVTTDLGSGATGEGSNPATLPTKFDEVSLFIDQVTPTTINVPPMAVCASTATNDEISPPGSVTKSSESASFDSACSSAGGYVYYTEGEYETYP